MIAFELDGQGSIPSMGNDLSLLHYVQMSSRAHEATCPMGIRGPFPGSQGLKLTIHIHLVLRLRMFGAVPTLPHASSYVVLN